MAEDDPFADLGKTLEDESDGQENAAGPQEPTTTPSDSTARADDESGVGQGENPDPMKDVAFTYEAANQRPFYAREETIEDFDAWLNYELERELNNRGYRNIVVREMTDALLRTVVEAELIDEIAEQFEHAREDAASKPDE
ncbi:hypothetical protein [Halococcus salifodinae]|uniref:hypothetical protein n=1 Tax=Halococcus salifodinae TaxID=36738 RepID=UPI000677C92E|nr:hypothetical protein [Halococcus salifodinae]